MWIYNKPSSDSSSSLLLSLISILSGAPFFFLFFFAPSIFAAESLSPLSAPSFLDVTRPVCPAGSLLSDVSPTL